MHSFPEASARLPDWRPRLASYLGKVARVGFRPGRHDCALFAAGAVEAMTGLDLAEGWRGKYLTLGSGRAMLRAQGFSDHLELVAFLFRQVSPAQAQVGDLAVVASDAPGDPGALGVVQGAGVYVLSPAGLSVVSRLHIEKAFRV
ncbi:DUF6950 family protein [Phaeobacter gallaeciensis]|uniref:DUF6950 family protein n=1 Tax=Phaeobacter gallaeciensis TaxID=60890 RepID=UPI00237F1D71|nr:hypothetical protein [Phaeobacter gallaeciensis]MDE4059777.1 hypothetical protein [Phaeobacter gallaeciensis]MDE4122586.1 hypothetical protein [Phaeobacter gallaeciensis]MDE4127265.1 hypothetical protein [Phaeobacter gallaeciensis]